MKHLLLLLSGIFFFANAHALERENTQLHGRITDQDKKPMEFVVVTLLKAEDSSLVKGDITDAAGNFSFENLNAGNFLVSASFTGYEKVMQGPFTVSGDQNLALEDIAMVPVKNEKEVVIAAAQPLFTQKADKLIMNVENSPVRIIGTAWDLLSTAPGVVVDQNAKITLRGKSGVLVYIDNKNTFLSGDQLMNRLQNIPATDIVSVEIITNPSAKYDAQGSGGIINFITKKGSQLGFNGSVMVGVGQAFYTKYQDGASFNYATAKFNVYAKYDFANWNSLDRSYINRNITYNSIKTNYNQHSSIIETPLANSGTLGIDFYAKHNITWGVRADGSFIHDRSNAINTTIITQSGSDITNELYQKNGDSNLFHDATANIYFDQKIDTNGRELSGSLDYLTYNTNDLQTFNLNYIDDHGNTTAPSENQRSNSLSAINILVGQLDYAHPFGKKYKLETGLKSSYVKTDNNLIFDFENNSGAWENDTTKSNHFIYTEQINAVYATGYATLGKWELEAGLRAEQTISDGNSRTTGERLKNSYIQLFPSVFILQKINETNSINYTYSRRVNRPDYQQLNPFVYYLDKYTYEQGNPFLQPEISNNVDVTYSFMDALFVSMGAGRTKHAMTDVTNQVDSTGIGYKTTVNLNNVDNGYFGISSPIPIGNWFMAEIELNESYHRFTSNLYGTNIDNKSWMFNGSTTFTFTLPHSVKFQIWGWYQGPGTYGIFYSKSQGGVGTSISKTFFNKQLSVNLVGNDLFHQNGMRASINFQGQDVYLEFIPETPRVFLRVRYSFGNKKATRKAESKSGAEDLKNRTGK
jgi:hypothetical protein